MAAKKFDESLKKLEDIVAQLEEGDLALEESLKLFEEGIKLSRLCTKQLEEAERKVEILLKNEEGEITTKPFNEEKDG
jgi:exodeoxyribonuclease VII small subunit